MGRAVVWERAEAGVSGALDYLAPIESIEYWANAYADPASGPHFEGHGIVVHLLREYANVRRAQNLLAIAPALREEQPLPHISRSDEQWWIRHRADVIGALEEAGLRIWDNADRVWIGDAKGRPVSAAVLAEFKARTK